MKIGYLGKGVGLAAVVALGAIGSASADEWFVLSQKAIKSMDPNVEIKAEAGKMIKPIKVWGGFAGAINAMTVQQEYVRDHGMYLPKKSVVEMEIRIMFSKGKLRLTEEYLELKAPAAPAVASGQ